MVRKFITLIQQEVRGLHEAAYLLGIFAVLSQLLALVRDRLLASSFGAGSILDVYYASFRIPDIIFVTVASFVSVYVLVPFLAEKNAISEDAEKAFIGHVFSFFTIGISLISILVFFAIPFISKVVFPGLVESPLYADLVLLTRILLLQPILLGISNLFGSITQTRQRFILYALSPVLYNVGIILGVLFLYPLYGIAGLGWGVVLGALLHLLIQVPFIASTGFIPRFSLFAPPSDIYRVMLLSLPRTIGLSVHQVALLVFIAFASLMVTGSITVFNFAFNLQAVPFAIIGISYSVAAFPTLARLYSQGERKQFIGHITLAARHILFWTLPVIALFVVLRAQIVRVILGTGAFDWIDTRLTAAALALFALSLTAQGLVMLLVRGYYAAGNTLKPLLVNTISAALAILFAFVFLNLFKENEAFRFFIESVLRVEGLPGTEILMLPLGYSLAFLINAALLWFIFKADFRVSFIELRAAFIHSLSAALVMGFVAHQFLGVFDDMFDVTTFAGIFFQGLCAGLLGIGAGIMVLSVLHNREVAEVWSTLRRKFWKTKTLTPEQTEL
jgi:putative peptidoglycan lipid II flippase